MMYVKIALEQGYTAIPNAPFFKPPAADLALALHRQNFVSVVSVGKVYDIQGDCTI